MAAKRPADDAAAVARAKRARISASVLRPKPFAFAAPSSGPRTLSRVRDIARERENRYIRELATAPSARGAISGGRVVGALFEVLRASAVGRDDLPGTTEYWPGGQKVLTHTSFAGTAGGRFIVNVDLAKALVDDIVRRNLYSALNEMAAPVGPLYFDLDEKVPLNQRISADSSEMQGIVSQLRGVAHRHFPRMRGTTRGRMLRAVVAIRTEPFDSEGRPTIAADAYGTAGRILQSILTVIVHVVPRLACRTDPPSEELQQLRGLYAQNTSLGRARLHELRSRSVPEERILKVLADDLWEEAEILDGSPESILDKLPSTAERVALCDVVLFSRLVASKKLLRTYNIAGGWGMTSANEFFRTLGLPSTFATTSLLSLAQLRGVAEWPCLTELVTGVSLGTPEGTEVQRETVRDIVMQGTLRGVNLFENPITGRASRLCAEATRLPGLKPLQRFVHAAATLIAKHDVLRGPVDTAARFFNDVIATDVGKTGAHILFPDLLVSLPQAIHITSEAKTHAIRFPGATEVSGGIDDGVLVPGSLRAPFCFKASHCKECKGLRHSTADGAARVRSKGAAPNAWVRTPAGMTGGLSDDDARRAGIVVTGKASASGAASASASSGASTVSRRGRAGVGGRVDITLVDGEEHTDEGAVPAMNRVIASSNRFLSEAPGEAVDLSTASVERLLESGRRGKTVAGLTLSTTPRGAKLQASVCGHTMCFGARRFSPSMYVPRAIYSGTNERGLDVLATILITFPLNELSAGTISKASRRSMLRAFSVASLRRPGPIRTAATETYFASTTAGSRSYLRHLQPPDGVDAICRPYAVPEDALVLPERWNILSETEGFVIPPDAAALPPELVPNITMTQMFKAKRRIEKGGVTIRVSEFLWPHLEVIPHVLSDPVVQHIMDLVGNYETLGRDGIEAPYGSLQPRVALRMRPTSPNGCAVVIFCDGANCRYCENMQGFHSCSSAGLVSVVVTPGELRVLCMCYSNKRRPTFGVPCSRLKWTNERVVLGIDFPRKEPCRLSESSVETIFGTRPFSVDQALEVYRTKRAALLGTGIGGIRM
jgi:hypothetical protein